jgi:hypothetical protein
MHLIAYILETKTFFNHFIGSTRDPTLDRSDKWMNTTNSILTPDWHLIDTLLITLLFYASFFLCQQINQLDPLDVCLLTDSLIKHLNQMHCTKKCWWRFDTIDKGTMAGKKGSKRMPWSDITRHYAVGI